MKHVHWFPAFASRLSAAGAIGLVISGAALAEDTRQLATLPPLARESLRQEMLDNLLAINEILTLVAADKIKEAGEVAEQKLGVSAQGKNRNLPFEARPGPHMPPDMHALGMDGHKAASEFAKAARAGERERALKLLPNLTSACVACHYSWRAR